MEQYRTNSLVQVHRPSEFYPHTPKDSPMAILFQGLYAEGRWAPARGLVSRHRAFPPDGAAQPDCGRDDVTAAGCSLQLFSGIHASPVGHLAQSPCESQPLQIFGCYAWKARSSQTLFSLRRKLGLKDKETYPR